MRATLLISLLALFMQVDQPERSRDLANHVVGQIPFVVEANKVVIPVRVGNSREFRVTLDSGMSSDGLLLYKPELKAAIDATEFRESRISGAGGGEAATAVIAESVSVTAGDLMLEDQQVIVLQSDTYEGFPRDGVIGYAIFGSYAVEIDYERSRIVLYDRERLQVDSSFESLPIYFKQNRIPWVDAEISIRGEADVPVSLYIDLASSEALELLLRDSMVFDLPDTLEDHYLGRGIRGDIHGRRVPSRDSGSDRSS
ncbi:MAG: aspartyl protease family protein [Vicinamibacterales bacterium]|jgi:hypothetical protein|nr:aspartyl protease family protein [Vicinamibacterales bacterium]MDP6610444.1 aspartyl protease family protein [Vicinamibacterales bacterium]MQG69597.1 hypothetical protein [SAR202 cluster bacterium]HAK53853.1 hypothetical protein [Acidobacteriota bacterium]|tara:strand:+ start:3086 stop:3853 length:768 start_codon:yes stop_codon:yes gene_type:complete